MSRPVLRLVLDTNVWLDWLVFDDPGIAHIAAAVAAGEAEVVVDGACEAELARVLGYPFKDRTLSTERQAECLARCRGLARAADGVNAGRSRGGCRSAAIPTIRNFSSSRHPAMPRISSRRTGRCSSSSPGARGSRFASSSRAAYFPAGTFQPMKSQSALPITSSRSLPLSHGSSSVNIVTHCFHVHGMRVMSVPQNMRCGPNASKICFRYLWMLR